MTPFLIMVVGVRMMDKYTENIDQTRKMLGLLPVEYLKSCESVNEYVSSRVNKKGWEIV